MSEYARSGEIEMSIPMRVAAAAGGCVEATLRRYVRALKSALEESDDS